MTRIIAKDRAYILNLNSRCNQQCLFCMVSGAIEDKDNIVAYESVCQKILTAKKNGFEKIDFFGGEPTVYPFLGNAIRFANKLGLSVTLATNAVKFASAGYAKKILKEDIAAIRTSLHSIRSDIHDAVTQVPGSHKKTLLGIQNIIKYRGPQRMAVNVVITRLNYNMLEEITKFLHNIGVPAVKFSGLSMEGRIWRNSFLVVDPSLVRRYLLPALCLCERLRMYFYIEKLPFCIAEGVDLEPSNFIYEKNQHSVKFQACRGCRDETSCAGVEKYLVSAFGEPDFLRMGRLRNGNGRGKTT